MIDLAAIANASLVPEPFPHLTAKNVLNLRQLAEIAADFPPITKPGIFPPSELKFGPAFARLLESIESEELERLIEEKFGIGLAKLPLMITVRGFCRNADGRIHNDSKDKVVTCLLYLNDPDWPDEGGRLRLLRSGTDLDDVIAEVPPNGGNFVAFRRTDNSWHGHAPFEGPRRYIMFNWLASDFALVKNVGRHKLSAAFKRLDLLGDH